MKVRFFCAVLCSCVFLSALSAFAGVNNTLRSQLYNTEKNRPYFATQKAFIDKFIAQLDLINFNESSASWKAIDRKIAVDEASFKKINNIYYLVFKTTDNGVIGLVQFRCKSPQNGGFRKIEAYSYKRYTPMSDVDIRHFEYIEEAACEG